MPIILFDGICNFCNRSINIILKHDKGNYFKFAASQSNAGINLIQKFNLNKTSAASVILIDHDKVYTKTDAVIQIATYLNGWPRLFSSVKFIPKPIRDFAYDWIAQNRYALFGKRETCRIPEESIRHRFLE
jgi:predicted DCC family thiol-disulfide oxidoreductase YuxK